MKNWVKVATSYGVTMGGFKIRIGSIYGENSGKLFVCADYSGLNSGNLRVYISRDNGNWWDLETLHSETKIFRAISEKITKIGKVPTVGTFREVTDKIVGQPRERRVNCEYIPMKDTRYQLSKHNGDNCDFGGRIINAELVHEPRNHMKVDMKKLPKPVWERPTNIPKDCRVKYFQTEGSLHSVDDLSVTNTGISYGDPAKKSKKVAK